MLKAYINYPNPHVTIHANAECSRIQQQHKQEQRVVRLEVRSLSLELQRFSAQEYQFGAEAETNDMWLELDFSDPVFEKAVVEYVRSILALHYSPFARVSVDEHCSPS